MSDVIRYNLKKDFKTKKDKMVDHCLNYKDRIFEVVNRDNTKRAQFLRVWVIIMRLILIMIL